MARASMPRVPRHPGSRAVVASTRALLLAVLSSGLVACDDDSSGPDGGADASVDPSIVAFRFEPDAEGFFRMPWPSDARLTDRGTPDLSDFPRRRITQAAVDAVETSVHGFAPMPVVYLPMQNGLEDGSIPRGVDATRSDSPLQLLDLSEEGCGTRLPLEARFDATGDSLRDDNVLRVANAIGTVLTPGHPYGLVVLNTLGDAEGRSTPRPDAFDAALRDTEGQDALSLSLAPLRRCAPDAGLALDDIAVATVFTPHDPVAEMQRLRDFVMDPTLETRAVRDWRRSDAYSRRRLDLETHLATVEVPIFQEGETPYTTAGGGLVFDDSGEPVVQRWEDVPVAVTYGRLEDPPDGPRPILIFEDGTGWSPWNHLNDAWTNAAIDAGYVMVSFMPQFHGGRAGFDGNTELSTFNLPNPPAGRSNFRQQAAETSYFIRVVREQIAGLDGLPELDLERFVYGGHSQGALCGAIVAGVESEFDAYVLNGLSSFLTLTLLHRKDIIDFAAVISSAFGFRGELDRFSLLLQLLQTGGSAVDPHNYVRRWRGWPGNPSGNHVFVINGREDDTTTPRGIEHLTMVADMPPLAPAGWDVDVDGVWDGEEVALPAMGNETALDGNPLTLATYLNASRGHFTVYREAVPRELAIRFWNTALDGVLELGEQPTETSCDDGMDNNGDDRVDCADPTCARRAPCAEERCGDEADDDGDGDVDCDDSDCSRSSACFEIRCSDGMDDDGDGATDCDDPDCAFACREANCTDGMDNDGDGATDCDDSDCDISSACRETRCSNGADEDGDGDIDCDDPDCQASPACPERMCTGGTDDDLDGLVDCADPTCSEDAACARERETNCGNGTDDDGDGEADCRDADCATFATCAAATCADGTLGSQTGIGLYRGTLEDAENDLPPGDCTSLGTGEGTADLVLAWTAPAAGTYLLSTAGSAIDTVLHVLGPTCEPATELACDDDEVPLATSALELTVEDRESVAIVVSGYDADDVGAFVLHIVEAP